MGESDIGVKWTIATASDVRFKFGDFVGRREKIGLEGAMVSRKDYLEVIP